jgi:hypothetical protein
MKIIENIFIENFAWAVENEHGKSPAEQEM